MIPPANIIEEAFSPLIKLFESIMVFIHDNLVGGSWGFAIIGLTVLIRAVLVPLTYRQLKSMQEMQRLAPQINVLKEKYKDDKQRQQQELMKFYQENKINPLASCLPLLLQLPVFISLFYMLRTDLKKQICPEGLVQWYNRHPYEAVTKYKHPVPVDTVAHLPVKFVESTACQTVAQGSGKFLFIPDITSKATGAVLVVLLLVYVGSQLGSTLVTLSTATDQTQRRLMLALPFIFTPFIIHFPAGLILYWITTNFWTFGQSFVVRWLRIRQGDPVLVSGGSDGDAAVVTSGGAAVVEKKPTKAPPPPPKQKKKRSGRRR